MMQLHIKSKIDKEIIHFAEGDTLISSKYRTIFFQKDGQTKTITLPEISFKKPFGFLRLTRRALRLDKCNVFLHQDNLIIIRHGHVYLYKSKEDKLIRTLQLRNCRNVLHQSINATPDGYIYFGEYGHNAERTTVPVYRSKDGGETWEEIYTFAAGSIKHIHGCYYDKFTDKIWVCTGDFKDENWMIIADRDFKELKKIGDGQQRYRACNLIFTPTEVHWLMYSQLETSYHIKFDRRTEQIEVCQPLNGPIWYIKELIDGYYLAATAQEIGAGVLDDKVHLYVSKDLKQWHTLANFAHDGLPKRWFKFGVVGFADGAQSSQDFYMFFEAVKEYDGVSLKCSIIDSEDKNPTIAQTQKAVSVGLKPYKNFKQVNVATLKEISAKVATNQVDTILADWCDKLLRYIEIRQSELQANERKAERNTTQSAEIFTHILALFVSYYQHTNDLRFLNTAIKILDLRWAIPATSDSVMHNLYQQSKTTIEAELGQLVKTEVIEKA